MKTLLIFLSLLSFKAFATIEYVSGNGNQFGLCTETNFSFCAQQVGARAKDDAMREAAFSCQVRGGHLLNYSGSCQDFCSPVVYPHGQPSTNVSCRADCRAQCEKN